MQDHDKTPVVHLADYAAQPDIHVACGGWSTPFWGAPPDGFRGQPEGTYVGEGRRDRDEAAIAYTFDRAKVTCPGCLRGDGRHELAPLNGGAS